MLGPFLRLEFALLPGQPRLLELVLPNLRLELGYPTLRIGYLVGVSRYLELLVLLASVESVPILRWDSLLAKPSVID